MRKRKPIIKKINWEEKTEVAPNLLQEYISTEEHIEGAIDKGHIEHMKKEMRRIGQEYTPIEKITEEQRLEDEESQKMYSKEMDREPPDDEANIMRQYGAGSLD
jgi:hypothetical protein